MKRIKLLVVDDSILFREVLARHIRQDEQIDVIGTAGDAYVARDMIRKYQPDVMTLDIEMPKLDGIAFLRKYHSDNNVPTIVISSCGDRKAEAMSAGASEFIAKPLTRTNNDMQRFAEMVCGAIKRAHTKSSLGRISSGEAAKPRTASDIPEMKIDTGISPLRTRVETAPPVPAAAPIIRSKSDIVIALGASTGGTEALEQVIRNFPENMPPVIVVQHMPAGFTKLYSERLDKGCRVTVKEAEDGDRLRDGLVIIGAGEHHLRLCKDKQGYYVSSKQGEKVSGHCPSVDVMFASVAETAKGNAIGAILTGMGRDGADGLLKMRNAGAFTIGQDKETSVVYGMPMEAHKIGAVCVQAPLYRVADIIMEKLK